MTLSQIEEIYNENKYFGRPTGNRHYQTGVTLPRLSTYGRAAIWIS